MHACVDVLTAGLTRHADAGQARRYLRLGHGHSCGGRDAGGSPGLIFARARRALRNARHIKSEHPGALALSRSFLMCTKTLT